MVVPLAGLDVEGAGQPTFLLRTDPLQNTEAQLLSRPQEPTFPNHLAVKNFVSYLKIICPITSCFAMPNEISIFF